MNIKQLQEKLKQPKYWVFANISLAIILGIVYLMYSFDQSYQQTNNINNKIKDYKIQSQNLKRQIQTWQTYHHLPLLKDQVQFAQDYFSLYGLTATLGKKVSRKNYQELFIDGKLTNALLALNDLNYKKFPITLGNIAIDKNRAAFNINILGKEK